MPDRPTPPEPAHIVGKLKAEEVTLDPQVEIDYDAVHAETMRRYPQIMKRLAE